MKTQKFSIISTIANSASQSEMGRDYLVAEMIPIVGDTIMNQILYPDDVVSESYSQLNNLLAPDRHPSAQGVNISAYDPIAINANHFGAFARNPRKSGKKVTADLWIDKDVANRTERGRTIINAIETGATVGVSVGGMATLEHVRNDDYGAIVKNIAFDHVAVLLEDKPAGADTYIQNEEETVLICNRDTESDYTPVIEDSSNIVDNNETEETITMEHDEMVAELLKTGFAVVENSRLESLETLEAEKLAVVNAKRAELSELSEVEQDAFANVDESTLDKLIANAKEFEAIKNAEPEVKEPEEVPVDNSLRQSGSTGSKKQWYDEVNFSAVNS